MRKLAILAVTALLLMSGAALAQEDPTNPDPVAPLQGEPATSNSLGSRGDAPPAGEVQGFSSGNGYSLTSVIGSGGGTSTGGNYVLNGTIGQFEASPPASTGGNYSLFGGFWPRVIAPPGTSYDTNGDGYISPVDAVLVVNRVGETVTSSNSFADVDGDNDIDQADVQAVVDRLGQID